MNTPALDVVARAPSPYEGLTKLMRSGRLEQAHQELGRLAKAADTLAGTSKAARYERLAKVATDPEIRRGYTELTRRERTGAA